MCPGTFGGKSLLGPELRRGNSGKGAQGSRPPPSLRSPTSRAFPLALTPQRPRALPFPEGIPPHARPTVRRPKCTKTPKPGRLSASPSRWSAAAGSGSQGSGKARPLRDPERPGGARGRGRGARTLSWDLETLPLWSRSSAVKACQMALSSSSLRPPMAAAPDCPARSAPQRHCGPSAPAAAAPAPSPDRGRPRPGHAPWAVPPLGAASRS